MIVYITLSVCSFIIGMFVYRFIVKMGVKTKHAGNIVAIESDEKITYTLEMEIPPEDLQKQKTVSFNIVIPDNDSDRE